MVQLKKRLKGVFNLQPYDIDTSLPAMQIVKKLPEKFPAEVIDGQLYVHEPVTVYHAQSEWDIASELKQYVISKGLGKVYGEPVGVFLDERKHLVMPDIFFVSRKREHLLKPDKGLLGAPDLVIEILSPGTRKYNFTEKKDLYENYGVKEYWLVDPITKEATGFRLRNGKYGQPLVLKGQVDIRILKKTIKF